MDWQHLIMNGESLGEYAAMLAAEGLLGHQHANSGWGTFDDDNMVGATAFMETLELAVELRRARYGENGERLGFDLYPYTEDAVAAVARSVKQWRFIWDVSRPDRRRRAPRGAVAQGRRPRLRARLRRARRVSRSGRARDRARRARRRHDRRQGGRDLAGRRGARRRVARLRALDAAARAGPSRIPRQWWTAAESALAEVAAGREVAGIGLSGQMHGLVVARRPLAG